MNGRKIPVLKTVTRDGKTYQQTFWMSEEDHGATGAQEGIAERVMNGSESIMMGRAVQIGKSLVTDLYNAVSEKVRIADEKLTHAGLHADEVTAIQHEMGENYIIAKKITTITATPFLKAGALGLRSMQKIADSYSESNGDSGYKVGVDVDGGQVSFTTRKEASDEDVTGNLMGIVNGDDCGGPSVIQFVQDVRNGKVMGQYQSAVDNILCDSYDVSVAHHLEKEPDGFGEPMVWDRNTSGWPVGIYSTMSGGSEKGVAFSYAIDPADDSLHRISPIYVPNDESPFSTGYVQAAKDNVEGMKSYWEAVDQAGADPRSIAELLQGN